MFSLQSVAIWILIFIYTIMQLESCIPCILLWLVKSPLTRVARLVPFPVRVTGTSAVALKNFFHNSCTTIKLSPSCLPCLVQSSTQMHVRHMHSSPSFKAVFRMNQPFLFQQLMWSVFSILRGYDDFEWASFQSLDYAKPQLLRRLNTP